MFFPNLLTLLCLLLFISTPSVDSSIVDVNRFRNGQIESGFALMEVKDVGEEKAAMELCVNFQQFEKRPVPEGPFRLVWWNSSPGLTTICHPPTKPHQFDGNELLPLDYITNGDELGELCRQNNPDWTLKMGGSVEFQVSNAESTGIKTILFLVPRNGVDEKEGNNSTNLHSKFCNAEINGRAQDNGSNIFYIYDDVFDQQVVPKLRASRDRLELRFRRPSHGFDLGLPFLWLLCLIAVALGSIWSAKAATARLERKSTKRQQRQQQQISGDRGTEAVEMEAANKEAKKKPFSFTTLIWAIMIVVLICVIYAAFWLATNAQQVLVASLLWTAFGIFCMAKCLFALCKYVLCPRQYGQQKPFFQYQRIRLTGLGLLCYLLSAAICLPWPFVRPKPWAFVLLDLMSVCMVAYLIKYLSYESLKKKQIWSPRARLIFTTILFVIGILWLIFLHSAKTNCEPKAPIVTLSQTETFGSLIMPILSDPLAACWDTQIETGFHFISIPFVSIVISAAVSVPMWFHVDFVNGRRFPYGFAALFGYSLGLLFVLFFMMYFNSVHWLLAYLLLMPWSIYAVLILALIKGTHKQLLKGEMISADHQIN